MKSKKIAGVCLSAVLACGSLFGISACQKDDRDPQIVDVYNMYVAYAEATGETPMTYEQWLDSIKGDKGDKGDPGEPGVQGKSAYEIWKDAGNDGSEEDFLNWLKGAKGDPGEPGANGTNGTDGQRGTKIFTGEALPNNIQGAMAGDLYINTTNWDIYTFNHYDEGPNQWEKIGNIKGEKGDQGPEGPQGPKGDKGDPGASGEVATPAEQKVNIAQDGEQYISLSGLEVGTHIVIADLETKLTTGRLQVQVEKEGAFPSEIVFSEARSTEAGEGHNIYFGYINVPEGASNAKVFAKGEAVNATISFEDYEIPTLKVGETIDVCVNAYGTATENLIKFKVDTSMKAGSYKILLTHLFNNTSSDYQTIKFFLGKDTTGKGLSGPLSKEKSYTLDTKNYEDSGETYAYLLYATNVPEKLMTYPMTMKITAA